MNKTHEAPEVRAFSVRVAEPLYHETRRLAERRKVSVNALISQSLTRLIEEAQDEEMWEAATQLGMDAEMSDVSFAFSAQAEVVLSHD